MIRNYIKTAFRSLMKNKGFTIINVLGLALGLATCLLIVFYVFDELSYDRYNEKADRIYRVNDDIKFGGNTNSYAVSPAPMAAAMKADFPEIEQIVRFRGKGGNQVKKGNQNIEEDMMIYADPSVFDVFTLPMISGSPTTALTEPHTIVITEQIAQKYFNKTNVVGQVLTFNDTAQYKITGVIKNIPHQSHFHFDFFISMSTLAESRDIAWLSSNFNTYILLKPGTDYKKLEAKFDAFYKKHAGPQLEDILHLNFAKFEQGGNYIRINLIPVKKIHLYSNRVAEFDANGNIDYVYIFSAIAIFILLIACVNFMNLSTARSSNRAREVGVRKVLGSARKYLIAQFLTESIIVTLLGAVIAVFAAWALLPLFNQMSGKELIITPHIVSWLIPALFIIIIVIGCLAGSYPALFLSGFNPIDVLKGKLANGFKGGLLRSFLVVFQFAISIFLIIGTLVIYNQLKFIQNKDLGYNRDHVLTVGNIGALGNSANTFKQEVKQIAGVTDASLSEALPTWDYGNGTTLFKDQAPDQKRALNTQFWGIDEDYINTLGMKIIKGRNFSKEMLTDSTGLIINEAAAKVLAFSNPIDQKLYAPTDNMVKNLKAYHIVGVIKDFNFKSLRLNVTPLVFRLDGGRGAFCVRVNSANIPALLAQIKKSWSGVAPNYQFDYSFLDQQFDSLYRSEQRIGTIVIAFTSLAIIIACLGLFGLAAYAAEQRTKEIGIRKILGANMSTIVGMLSKDFIGLVAIAIAIASPLAWWAMKQWLEGFAYRQNIQWWELALAGIAAVFIAFITISFQSIRAALTNPVKSLRSE
ncbi:putative ABC transport system permease protein [Mucilaginibacter frigoritolerans]|uniref:Putative ABC transport system permease protein n=1 Tax=Mucilaginibacter frigoritolerans TaxID=652788 RepID=A0A562UHI8_9SPHI|nr:ABC transporter permease [Mucilaginibacter frigoritolerans]TWJ04887.1 putative ABC transport system permease protein [Mucilaginibacter frigoritolerans]